MARRRQARSDRVVELEETARTARTYVRCDALKRIVPSVAASAAAVGIAVVEGPATGVNAILATLLAVTVPSALAKILWDAGQKRRLRARITDLENKNRILTGRGF